MQIGERLRIVVAADPAGDAGRPLIGINFDLQKYDADFRFRMIRIGEYAESLVAAPAI